MGAADVLGVTWPALSGVLNGRAALSVELVLLIEKAFGVSMEAPLRMQLAYDIARVRRQEKKIKNGAVPAVPRTT